MSAALLSRISKLSWRYAIGEILLIFTGITLSLWFNDWNEYRKEREEELKMLREIRNEILLDTIDLGGNLTGYRAMVRSDSLIENFFLGGSSVGQGEVQVPSSQDIAQLKNDFLIIFHTSAYETLKARGIELIHNDSLRSSIVRLYDFDYKVLEMLQNMNMMKDIKNEMNPHFIRNFKLARRVVDDRTQLAFMVKDAAALKKDEDFWTVFQERKFLNSRMLAEYTAIQKKIIALSQAIDKEIASRQ